MSADDPQLTPTPTNTLTPSNSPVVGLAVTGDAGSTGDTGIGKAIGAGAQAFGKGMQGAAGRGAPNLNVSMGGAPPPAPAQRDAFDVIFGHGGTATAAPSPTPLASAPLAPVAPMAPPMVATSDRRAKVGVHDGTAAVRRFLDALAKG